MGHKLNCSAGWQSARPRFRLCCLGFLGFDKLIHMSWFTFCLCKVLEFFLSCATSWNRAEIDDTTILLIPRAHGISTHHKITCACLAELFFYEYLNCSHLLYKTSRMVVGRLIEPIWLATTSCWRITEQPVKTSSRQTAGEKTFFWSHVTHTHPHLIEYSDLNECLDHTYHVICYWATYPNRIWQARSSKPTHAINYKLDGSSIPSVLNYPAF
jgi:hypothetical protein